MRTIAMNARILQRAAVGVAALGLLAPPTLLSAAEPSATERPETIAPAATAPEAVVLDVALSSGGVFSGQVVDAEGRSQAGSSVMVCQQQQVVATATTDQQGQFSIRGLQGGVYQVVAGQGMKSFRLWAPDTAPPGAQQSALLVADGQSVRGQGTQSGFGELRRWVTNPWVISIAVAAAIAVPIAVFTHDQASTS
jgi:Carboxypeptidase regulatory-like domain